MKKKLKNILISTLIFASVFFLIRISDQLLGYFFTDEGYISNTYYRISINFLKITIIFLWMISLIYEKVKKIKLLKNPFIFQTTLTLLMVFLLYLSYYKKRVDLLYIDIKNNSRGWEGKVHQKDLLLGFKPIPNATGYHLFKVGPKIPMRYDDSGFRVPFALNNNIKQTQDSLILFFGCSFTYGDGCYAEETFPYLVAEELGYDYINAGVCSYGLTQILILSRDLIPKYKPKYIVLQHSPWLSSRAADPYASSYNGKVPVPYFTKTKDTFTINKPLFLTRVFDVPINKFRTKESGFFDYVKFNFQVGYPLMFLDDLYALIFKFTKVNKPGFSVLKQIEQFVYAQINNLCQKNNSKLIILNLGDIEYTRNFKKITGNNFNCLIANADSLLWANLKNKTQEGYGRKYKHWRFDGKDSIIVDAHPNPYAHMIISESIISCIINEERPVSDSNVLLRK